MITFRELGRTGRLGNMLFQVAGCIGIARKSGQTFGFPKLICHDMVERFDSKEDHEVYKYLVNPLPEISIEEIDRMNFNRYHYFWEYRDIILPKGNWDMYAHFQSIKFFEHCIDEIRHYFTFKHEPGPVDMVAVHFRGGDYIDNQDAYHPRCSKEYYQKAMAQFPEGTKFIVFTDDPNAATDLFSTIKGHTFFLAVDIMRKLSTRYEYENTDYMGDFSFMKNCKSFICANSSFSHMAALLGTHPEKKIVMPRHWFGSQAGGLNFDSLYPLNAIIL